VSVFDGLFGRRRPSALEAVSALLDAPPPPRLAAAVEEVARVLSEQRLGRAFAGHRPRLILIFARQSADAAMRLSSSHWVSDGGHNVGRDILQAYGAALGAFLAVLDRRPQSKTPLLDAALAREALMTDWRTREDDPDGYGIATLGEIRRDLATLL
jgi:hypothetical protein